MSSIFEIFFKFILPHIVLIALLVICKIVFDKTRYRIPPGPRDYLNDWSTARGLHSDTRLVLKSHQDFEHINTVLSLRGRIVLINNAKLADEYFQMPEFNRIPKERGPSHLEFDLFKFKPVMPNFLDVRRAIIKIRFNIKLLLKWGDMDKTENVNYVPEYKNDDKLFQVWHGTTDNWVVIGHGAFCLAKVFMKYMDRIDEKESIDMALLRACPLLIQMHLVDSDVRMPRMVVEGDDIPPFYFCKKTMIAANLVNIASKQINQLKNKEIGRKIELNDLSPYGYGLRKCPGRYLAHKVLHFCAKNFG
ncbi:hypothetical protein ACOME3_006890 [Neoechinorhynchus agilis]